MPNTPTLTVRLPPALRRQVETAFPATSTGGTIRTACEVALLAQASAAKRLEAYFTAAEWSLMAFCVESLHLSPSEWETLPTLVGQRLLPFGQETCLAVTEVLNQLDPVELGYVYTRAKGTPS